MTYLEACSGAIFLWWKQHYTHMEYFEELALGPEYPIPCSFWKLHVDDIISIVKRPILIYSSTISRQ